MRSKKALPTPKWPDFAHSKAPMREIQWQSISGLPGGLDAYILVISSYGYTLHLRFKMIWCAFSAQGMVTA